MKTKADVLHFIVACIAEHESDGHQVWEDSDGNVPNHLVPDSWSHDDKSEITIVKGDREFLVKVSIPRKRVL